MNYRLKLLCLLLLFGVPAFTQTAPAPSCGEQPAMQHLFSIHPEFKAIHNKAEKLLAARNRAIREGSIRQQRSTAILTLPVVVHIVHNNGAENISDVQVFQGIQHLNEAFANSGYYDPADGVNTQIQFCMAQRDPSNNPTNGITRDVSPYTVMNGPDYYSDDQSVKDIVRWNPRCYINIWLVKSIPGSVVGYAYLPAAHGSSLDGIIIEAGYFGSSYPNDVVVTHEMGHYLGLYHTFEGGCTNNDCSNDGDHVCDTPPDQSTAGISCTSTANSCTTDVLSGFATDQNDLTQDYMDYGNFNCMKVFTQGQSDRMNWFINNVRESLLACKSCMNPCPAPVTADFSSTPPFIAGSPTNFTSTSVNANSYEWFVNGVSKGTGSTLNYIFPSVGTYTVTLTAHSGNALCDDDTKSITVKAVCGVAASFTKSNAVEAAGTPIVFTNTSTGADQFEWYVNSVLQSTTTSFSYTSNTAGDYIVHLVAKNSAGMCSADYTDTVHFTCAVIADFVPASTAALVNTAVSFTSTGSGGTTYQWLVNGAAVGSGPSFAYTFTTVGAYTVQLVSGNGTCNASATGVVYINDKCGNAQYQFQKTFSAGLSSGAMDIRPTADGGIIAVERVITTGGAISGGLLKIDAAGNSEWMNHYFADGNSALRRVRPTPDGGYIAIGYTTTAGSNATSRLSIIKTDATGNITWNREMTGAGFTGLDGADIIVSSDGSYYFTGTVTVPAVTANVTDVLIGRLDGSGILSWSKTYDARGAESSTSLVEDKGLLVVCGNISNQGSNGGFLLQVDKTNGNVVWAKSYVSTDENFTDVQTIAGGYFVNANRRSNPGNIFTDHVYLETDLLGNVTYSTFIRPFPTGKDIGPSSAIVNNKGHIISQTSGAFGGTYYDFILQEIDPVAGILWSKTYNKNAVWLWPVTQQADKSIWSAGSTFDPTAPTPLQTYIVKADSAGNTGNCPSANANVSLLAANYAVTTADFIAKFAQLQVSRQLVSAPLSVAANVHCQYLQCDSVPVPVDTCTVCNQLQITGRDTVCHLSDVLTLAVLKSPFCPNNVQWKMDTAFGSITTINDSTIQILFKKTGVVKVFASCVTSCRTLTDSMNLSVFNSPATIDLGPDIQLCTTSTLTLHAGSGFASYTWSDGSTDSTLTVYVPGTYSVVALDYCGNVFKDALVISQGPLIPFDLGPDIQKCNHDTITISAPGAFSSYTWSANYAISSVSGATVKVWPDKDTTYTVVAYVQNGCTVVDTIRVKVLQTQPIYLGADTSFCDGDSIVLHAPGGFAGYLWQDGTKDSTQHVFKAGKYWLEATDANGCSVRDTLTVNSVYPSPVQFLDAEAETCEGKDLVLKANGTWKSFNWFNNSTGPSVIINMPGRYWLQVTSADGCTAKDTIVVSSAKGCFTNIHFPNAFTPDNNGSNDVFRPIVDGMPVVYRIDIYNRFGQKVFETSDCKKGWNGIFNGVKQPPGGYAWYCVYQFNGLAAKIEKGTMLLIR